MALPVTIGGSPIAVGDQNSYHGPFKSSGGAFYTVLEAATGPAAFGLYKATDPTSSFSEQDSSNRPGFAAGGTSFASIWLFQDGDDIHVIGMQTGTSNHAVLYARADMSSDAWVDVDTGDNDIQIELTGSTQSADACTIAVRSDGDIVVVYQGDSEMLMGAEFERIDWNVSTDGGINWAGPVSIDNGGKVDWTGCVIVPGKDDRMHVFFKNDSAADAYQRRINSDDSLETFPSAFEATLTAHNYPFGPGVSYDDGGTQRVRCPFYDNATGTRVSVAKLDSQDTPSVSIDQAVDDSGNLPVAAGTVARVALAVDSKNLQLLWSGGGGVGADKDLYRDTNDDDAGWGTDTEELDGVTLNHISPKVYDRSGKKLAFIYDDGGTVKYNEIVLAAGDVNINALTEALTLAPQAATVNAETSLTANTEALTLAPQAATIKLETIIAANTEALTLAAQAATVNAETSLTANTEALTLASQAATVNAETSLTANTEALTVATQQATIKLETIIVANTEALTLAPQAATVNAETNITANTEALTIAPQAAAVSLGINIDANTEALTLAPQAAMVNAEISLTANTEALTLAPQAATITTSADVEIVANTEALILASQAATVNAETNLAANTEALTLAPQAATVSLGININALTEALTLAPQAAAVNAETNITANTEALALATLLASVTLTSTAVGEWEMIPPWLKHRRIAMHRI